MESDSLESLLRKAITRAQLGTQGYWIDPAGTLHPIGKQIHQDWALKEKKTTSQGLLQRGWGQVRIMGDEVSIKTDNRDHIFDAMVLAKKKGKRSISLDYRGNFSRLFYQGGEWMGSEGQPVEDYLESSLRPTRIPSFLREFIDRLSPF